MDSIIQRMVEEYSKLIRQALEEERRDDAEQLNTDMFFISRNLEMGEEAIMVLRGLKIFLNRI